MKLLLLGANGQVGWELRRALAPLGDVVTLKREDRGGDLRDAAAVTDRVREVRPAVIVNAAAYTAVDKAECERDVAFTVNATAPGVLAREARSLDALMVHYSTDYVFDGSGAEPWREDSPTGPINAYGESKLAGEDAIRESGCRHLILRTSWVYAARGQNFVRTMLRLAKERDELTVIDDQHGAPTGAELLADTTAHSIRAVNADGSRSGTYHLAATGVTTWHGYARHILTFAGRAGLALRAVPERVRPVPSSGYVTAARRPLNSRLDVSRFEGAFGLRMPDWRIGVDRVLDEILGRP